jgi:flagellar hook-associated protein FlgK
MGSALAGIDRGFQGIRRVASEIASVQKSQQPQPTDLSRAMVEMQQHAHQAKASVKVMKTADQMLGTLFDERA